MLTPEQVLEIEKRAKDAKGSPVLDGTAMALADDVRVLITRLRELEDEIIGYQLSLASGGGRNSSAYHAYQGMKNRVKELEEKLRNVHANLRSAEEERNEALTWIERGADLGAKLTIAEEALKLSANSNCDYCSDDACDALAKIRGAT